MATTAKSSISIHLITTFSFYVFCVFFACDLLSEVLGEISSPTELTGIAGQDVTFQFNTTGKNAIKGAKFGLDGKKSYPIPKFITVLKNRKKLSEEIEVCGKDLDGSAAANYKGRVSFVGDLEKGHAWFRLSNISPKDTNLYMCEIREDSDGSYRQRRSVKLTVRETEHTDFEGIATKTIKSDGILSDENELVVADVLSRAYLNMPINHKMIKVKIIRRINKTVAVWFHIKFAEAATKSYAISFLEMAQRNDRLRGYDITCFEKLDVKPVRDKPKGSAPSLIALYVIIALVVVAVAISFLI